MKKSLLLVTFAASLLLAGYSGCSNEHKEKIGSTEDAVETYTPAPEMTTNGNDTMEVINKVNDFVSCLKGNDVNGAMRMLYFLDGDSIKKLPADVAQRIHTCLGAVAGCPHYDVDGLVFHKEKDSQVRIKVTLFDKAPDDPRPNETKIVVAPVRRQGKWYLTMEDTPSDTNQGTEIDY